MYAIVNTITAMDGISKVQFLIEGKQTQTLSGTLCLADPFLKELRHYQGNRLNADGDAVLREPHVELQQKREQSEVPVINCPNQGVTMLKESSISSTFCRSMSAWMGALLSASVALSAMDTSRV